MKKTQHVLALVLTIAMMVGLMTGCGSSPSGQSESTGASNNPASTAAPTAATQAPQKDDTIHVIGGGSTGGGYHTISTVLAQYFSDKGIGNFTAQPTTGGVQNGLLMQAGELDVAIINGANCMEAYTASSENFSEPYSNLRAIAVLYSGCFQMAVANKDDIQTMADLAGRKVGIGGTGSGDNGHAKRVFGACGFGVEGIDPQYIGVNESTDQLKDGHIDGFVNVGSLPLAVITDITMSGKGKIIGLTEEEVGKLTTGEDAVYFPYVIPANTYDNQPDELKTVALPTVLCVDADRISEEMAYEITKLIYENIDELKGLYAGFDIDPQASLDAIKIPLHAGAERYYKEINLM